MRFSLKALVCFVSLAALMVWIATLPTAAERLRAKGVGVGHSEYHDSLMSGISDPTFWVEFLNTGTTDDNRVEAVWFAPGAKITESDIRILAKFPNLRALRLPCNFEMKWLLHLKNCPNLSLVSLENSNATDEAIDLLIGLPKLYAIYTQGTQVSEDAIHEFTSSTENRIANAYYTD